MVAGDRAGGPQRLRDRDVLRHHLAEDHRQRGGEDQGHHHRDPGGDRVGQPGRGEQRPDELADQRFGEVAGDQCREGDRDLGTRQLEGERAVRLLDGEGPAIAGLADVGVDGAAFERGERELGGHGEAGADGQQHEQEDAEDGEHGLDHSAPAGAGSGSIGQPGRSPGPVLSPGACASRTVAVTPSYQLGLLRRYGQS